VADPAEPVPDATLLTDEQRTQIFAWVNKYHAGKPCAVCEQRTWTLVPHLVAPPIFRKDTGLFFGGPAYPQAMLLCRTCGNTLYFNAVIMGAVPKAEDPPKAEEPPKGGSDG
jgi:hypothetical protein